MTASNIHPSTAVDQQNPLRLGVFEELPGRLHRDRDSGTLAGTGLVLWLLKALATSRYGVYFGV